MKVIIAYASCGSGHTKAAVALAGYLRNHRKEVDVQLVDILDTTPYLYRLAYRQGYFFLVNHALFLWRFGFWFTRVPALCLASRRLGALLNRACTKKFTRLLLSQKFDYCLATHFLVTEIVVGAKLRHRLSVRVLNVVTDFEVHPYWITRGTDRYFIASQATYKRIRALGVPDELIEISGIPVEEKFFATFDRKALGAKFGIPAGTFCVLMTTGSFGIGPLEQLVKLLPKDAHVFLGIAHNQALAKKISGLKLTNVTVFGFVDFVHELMAMADCLITKPGGLTISEALLMQVPLFFTLAIPGQEEGNIAVLKEYGLTLGIQKPAAIVKEILELKNDPQKAALIKARMLPLRKPDAAKVICDAIR